MKRKLVAFSAVVASALFMQSAVYANMPQAKAVTYSAEFADGAAANEETAAEETAAEAEESEKPLSSYADTSSENFINIDLVDKNGKAYTLVANIAYSYKDTKDNVYASGAIITNISQDSKTAEVDIVIPSVVDTPKGSMPVIAVGEAAFDYSYATSITVPSSVLEIHDRAFINCPKLKTLTVLGPQNTPKCDINSKATIIPTVIGDSIAANCVNLETASINGYATIGSSTFEGDKKLTKADIYIEGYNALTSAGEYNTKGALRTVTIADRTFYGCESLVNGVIMDSVKKIGKETFLGCKALKTVTVGATLSDGLNYDDFILPKPAKETDLVKVLTQESEYLTALNSENAAFDKASCTALEKFVVSGDNTKFSSVDGILYDKKQTKLLYYPMNSSVKVYNVPETVTNIDNYALYKNPVIKTVNASGTAVLNIGTYGFYRSSVENLNLNREGKITVGKSAFSNCENLVSLVTEFNHGGSMSDYAFWNCDMLGDTVLRGWVGIGDYAFADCDKMRVLEAAAGVGTIGDYCFAYCDSLEKADLSYAGHAVLTTSQLSFGTYVFNECPKLKEAYLSDTLLGISTGTFYNCTELEKVECGDDAAVIENFAFYNCSSLKSLSEIRFLVRIENNAFEGCTSLPELRLTRSVMYINESAFKDCGKLNIVTPSGYRAEEFAQANNISYSNMNDDIQDYEFLCYYPVEYKSDGTRSVNTKLMYAGSDLIAAGYDPAVDQEVCLAGYRGGFSSISIPSDDTCLAKYMYDGWSNRTTHSKCSMRDELTYVSFGKIEEIGISAFSSCKNLETIKLCKDTRIIDKTAFSGCKVLKGDPETNTIMLPLTMTKIGESAFKDCISIEAVDTDFRDPSYINSDKVSEDFKIDKLAFQGCTSLKTFNKSFTEFDVQHLNTNDKIRYFLKEIGEDAFKNCTSLESVYFNGNLEKIGVKAFENCTSLESVTLDNSVLVQTNAFIGCENLKSAIIVGEANVAVSNDPFCSTDTLQVATTKDSKAETYVKDKNATTGINFQCDYREFSTINGKAYVRSYVSAPANVIVYKNGEKMDTKNDYVIYTNELTFAVSDNTEEKKYSFFINGELVGEKYVVPEVTASDTLVVTYEESDLFKKGDVNADGNITSQDSAWALQHTLNPAVLNLDAAAITRADVDESGSVAASDSAMILQKALNGSYEFPKKS